MVEDVWRFFVAPFLFADQIGYAFVTLVAVGIFGTLLERRFGALPVIVVFVLSGAAGMALVAYAETPPLFTENEAFLVFGANGAALGLLCAWLVDDRMAARRGEDRENDLLGVYVVAIVLVLLSLAEERPTSAPRWAAAWRGACSGWSCRSSRARPRTDVHRRAGGGGRPGALRPRALRGRRTHAGGARPSAPAGPCSRARGGRLVRRRPPLPGTLRRRRARRGRAQQRIETLLAEETRMGMLVGVAVGWELARELA